EDFDVFSGTEEYLLDGLREGFAGSISATFNLFAKEGAAVMRCWQGEEADAVQDILTQKRRTVAQYPLFPAAKGLIARRKEDGDWANIRPPQMPLDEDIIEELDRKLAGI
ncbi:MAG TPA: dihydrodipicolinate synthase family protein, partial [Rhizobiales bacterium]|nr:dihydrodipicolinate synthase family protein [Hyphomicrobiales bacterium]